MGEIALHIEPDQELPEAAEIYVEGKIGSKPYRFLLDTGAAKTSVIWNDYTASFASVGKKDSSGVFATSSNDLIIVPSIEVGSISKQDFIVARMSRWSPAVRNLIGMDILKDYRCKFLFNESRVLLNEQSAISPPLLDLSVDEKFHPYLDVVFGTTKASAVWDTGAGITIADKTFVQKNPDIFTLVGQSFGTDSTGTEVETAMYRMGESHIGNHIFPPHLVAEVDLSPVNATLTMPMDLILGYSTLRQVNWIFDFPRQKWAVLWEDE